MASLEMGGMSEFGGNILTSGVVSENFVVEAVPVPPSLGEEDDGDGLAEPVELQAAGAARVHDARVVDDLDGHAQTQRPQVQVRVRRRAEWVPDHKERHILAARFLNHLRVRSAKSKQLG